ncbi:pyridoxamine 5'-phosphate oxidase [Niveispirillum sp. BGYR6]|uniref:pyridoxamine 5'-phosphate oxidase n=1 Tax=Niveispirillum sp. BGYR6 TaxID=2971249 RepID=UPI0022B9C7FA|nr:pyridoxamine 5'-phosphate oxidase [Niveispirillum sp. BGYR6]MDG5494339.1 pyridoxamine 5'-phosphate oxidase [Niveispirillum sp. BGYR6]
MSLADATDPFVQFQTWFAEAEATEVNDANAMSVATVGENGRPSLRILLLKGFDQRGFAFFTNMQSRKGDQLAANAVAALTFHWKSLRRQVRIEGLVELVTPQEADEYFASRPRGSQIGAWASQQSRPLDKRETLEAAIREVEARYEGQPVPRPPHWSGYRVVPDYIEFWQDREFRLHDRIVFTRTNGEWAKQRFYP